MGNVIVAFAVIQTTGTLTYASRRPAGGTWGAPTLLSAPNDKGGVRVAGDDAGTFVVMWSPSSRLLVPGKAVLWTAAGISTEPV